MTNTVSTLSEAARAAVDAINKANETRFQELQEYNKIFRWTCFYFSGSDVADCCKATTEEVSRVLDPRYGCETNISTSTDWADFSVSYKNYQRFIFPSYEPLWKESNTDSVEFFPGSFITACEFLNAHLDVENLDFKIEENRAEWSCILAGMMFLNKLAGFRTFAVETYGIQKEIINKVAATSLEGGSVFSANVYTKALLALQRYVGKNGEELKKIHGGFYNTTCSFADGEAKENFLKLKEEYEAEVQKLYDIISGIGQLTLCWNKATTANTYIQGDNVEADININQFLNCCGEVIASDAGVANIASGDLQSLQKVVKELTTRVAQVETLSELDTKVTVLQVESIILIVVIIVLIIAVGYLMFKIEIKPRIEAKKSFEEILGGYFESEF